MSTTEKYDTPLMRKLKARRIELAKTVEGFAEREAAGEKLSDWEKRESNEAYVEYDRIGLRMRQEISRMDDEESTARAMEEKLGRRTGRTGLSTEARFDAALPEGRGFVDLPGAQRDDGREKFGRYMRSILLNDPWERRDLVEGTDTAGGFVVPITYAAPILDLVVNSMQVRQAGATIVPMSERYAKIARLDSDPVPQWRNEGSAIAESDAVFDQVTLTARALAVHTDVSLELLEDSNPGMGEILGQSLARSFALEADRVALYGTGVAPQPRGLKATPGVNIVHFSGATGGTLAATTAYPAIGGAIGRLKAKNYVPSGLIYAPRTEMQLGNLQETGGAPIQMPAYVRDAAPHLVSSQVPVNLTLSTSTDCSDLIVGDFKWMLLGMRTEFRVIPVQDAQILSNGLVSFIGWMRMDVQIARTAAFEILDGLRA